MISLPQAEKIIDAILSRARELDCRPISVVVVEHGAVVKAFNCVVDKPLTCAVVMAARSTVSIAAICLVVKAASCEGFKLLT